MLVKVLVKRHFKMEKLDEVIALLKKFRSDALDQPGYVCGETLIADGEPEKLMVISTWQSIEDWNNWKASKTRIENDAMLKIFQEQPTEYTVYRLGSSSN
ncbi:antibiotic biosynthesis monooxygenase [Desulfococcaceae bacterium HSG9]|nr:antibiotic biosynthesis monooxygenase [Desulfococcaceae bacterium HSG9]